MTNKQEPEMIYMDINNAQAFVFQAQRNGNTLNGQNTLFNQVFDQTMEIVTKDGDKLWSVNDTVINIEPQQINTSAQTTVPSVFIKKSNTTTVHDNHTDYDNEIAQLTADAMDPNWADINHTIPIPNNYVLQKYNNQITWESISSVQIDSLDVQKLYSATNGFPLFTNPNVPGPTILPSITNQYITSLDYSKITSIPSELTNLVALAYDNQKVLVSTSNNYQWSSVSTLLGELLTQLQSLSPPTTGFPVALCYSAINTPQWLALFQPNSLVSQLNTQTYIVTSNMQSNSINGDRISDNTIDFDTKLVGIWLSLQWLNASLTGTQTTNQCCFYGGNSLVFRQPAFTDITGQATNSQIQSITFSKISDPSAALSLVQALNTSPTTNQIMKYNGTTLVWATDDTVTLNALLTALNTQTVVNLNQIQSNATATKQFFQSLSGSNTFNTIDCSDLTGQITLSQIVGAPAPIKFLSSTNYSNSWVNLYFTNINGLVDLTQLPTNATATKQFLQSVSGVQSYNQISYSDLQNVPSKLTNFVNATQTTNYYLKATDNTSGVAWAAFPSIPSQTQPKSYWVNNAAGTLTYVTGTSGQLLSFDGSAVPYAVNQNTLSIGYSQLTSVPSQLTQIASSWGSNGQFLSTNGTNTLSWSNVTISSLSSLPQQNNLGFIGTNQLGTTTGKNMLWISGGNPTSDQLYYAQYASGNNSSWQVITGTNGNGGILSFRQNQTLQNIKGDNTQIYNQLLCYNTTTQQPEWQNMNATTADFLSGQNTIQSLSDKAVSNLTSYNGHYQFYYRNPVSSVVVNSLCLTVRNQNNTADIQGQYGTTFNGDGVWIGSASWSLYTQNSISGWSASGVTYTQRGYFNSTNWNWSVVSDANQKIIYNEDVTDQYQDLCDELLKINFKKWAYKDSKEEYICQKKCDGTIKYETKKTVSPCYQDLQDKKHFSRCIEYKTDLNNTDLKAAQKTVDWQSYSVLCSLALKQTVKKVNDQQTQIDQLKQENLQLKCRLRAIEIALGIE